MQTGLGRDAVHRPSSQITPEQGELLKAALTNTQQGGRGPYGAGALLRDLTAVRHLLTRRDRQHRRAAAVGDSVPAPQSADALTAALGHAADRIVQHYRTVTALVQEHHWLPARHLDHGSTAGQDPAGHRQPATSLDTVSWWGPRPEDREAVRLLAGPFFDHERAAGIRHGYDPFDRLVLHCAAAHAFAVQWPAACAPSPDRQITPAYRPLPNGRVDLEPLGDRAHPYPEPSATPSAPITSTGQDRR
ncbi:hypothetical protein AGRA3207_007354 [Actinomadura graeca]|uniref:Uncharacterized protein n=1 Tax=Actinomadura graeca TaxID=2750812 RepID=A0ABX8R4N8_9ACTN|nr:hypothetical protein [Actinomadura graeca]QXJ25803.1 hypothetical protein AGRA3207_007354 [Actinomadura graeca]